MHIRYNANFIEKNLLFLVENSNGKYLCSRSPYLLTTLVWSDMVCQNACPPVRGTRRKSTTKLTLLEECVDSVKMLSLPESKLAVDVLLGAKTMHVAC